MPWIDQVPIDKATGLLKKMFDGAIERTGRVWNIMHVMSVNPEAMRESYRLYGSVVLGKSPLSRVQRELLAVVVSKELNCHY
jgi:alkylhydroperoxidase family enzyme